MNKPTKVLITFVALVLGLLLLVQWIGSPIATKYVNRKLAEMPRYTGEVERVTLSLWRGTISVKNAILRDRNKPTGPSLVVMEKAAMTLAPTALLKGKVGGRGHITQLVMNLEANPPEEKGDTTISMGAHREWQRALQQTFPLEITRFAIEAASIVFTDPYKKPLAKLTVDQFTLEARDFTNQSHGKDELPAKIHITARLGGTGRLDVQADVDPSAPAPAFFVKMDVQGLQLVPIHDFIAAYALVDVSAGEFSVYSEVNAKDGKYAGYLKPFFKDLRFEAIPDPEKNLLRRAASKVASGAVDLLKNEDDQVATRAPFEGDFASNDVDVWTTIENLLRNAFVQGLREGLEGRDADSK